MRNFNEYEIIINPAQELSLDSLDEKLPEFGSYISLPPLGDGRDYPLTETGLVPQWQLEQGFELGLVQNTPMLDHFYEDETVRQERIAREKSKEQETKTKRAPLYLEPRKTLSRFSDGESGKSEARGQTTGGNHDANSGGSLPSNGDLSVTNGYSPVETNQKGTSGQKGQDSGKDEDVAVEEKKTDAGSLQRQNKEPVARQSQQNEEGEERHRQDERKQQESQDRRSKEKAARQAEEERQQQERHASRKRAEEEEQMKRKQSEDQQRRKAEEVTRKRVEEEQKAKEEQERKRIEEEQQQKRREEEQQRKRREEEQQRKRQEEQERKQEEERQQKQREEQKRHEEQARKEREEGAARKAKEEQERKRREAEEMAQRAKEEEERKAREAAEAEVQHRKAEDQRRERKRKEEEQLNIKLSCSNVYIDRKFMLRAFCKTLDGREVAGQFNLNTVISFDGMQLRWDQGGGYIRYARRAWGGADGIWAECRVGRAWKIVSLLDMHQHIWNDNGTLRFARNPLNFG